MNAPDAATRIAGVVGHPVAHSLSPAIHNAALRHEGRNAVYLAFDVDEARFDVGVEGLRTVGARGLNVTVPHKGAAYACSTTVSEEARRTEAVNTLVFEDDGIAGHNTDVGGIRSGLADLGADIRGGRVLIIGAGGAGRAAAFAVRDASELLVTNRTEEKAIRLVEQLGPRARSIPWRNRGSVVGDVGLVVHATSLGLDDRASALDEAMLEHAASGGCRALLDLVYGLDETPLVRCARAMGLRTEDGLGVLVHQAAEAYALLWGSVPDLDVMRAAAWAAAGRRLGQTAGR